MQDMDPQSTRAQFTQVTTPGEPNMANVSNHLPSPSMALELDTPRAVEVVAGDGIPTGAWAAGLFDCFDSLVPNCFMVTLCPCVALAQLSTRLGVASYRLVLSLLLLVTVLEITSFALVWTMSDDDDDSSDEGHYYYYGWEHSGHSGNAVANGTFAVLTLLVQMLLFVYIWQLRVKTRTRFQLPGNAATDCLSSWFCSCCTVAQLRTHVRCYQPGDCSLGAPDVLQAYPGKSYAV